MSLINEVAERRGVFEYLDAPLLPGEGPIVYLQTSGSLLIVARLAQTEILASIWSWRAGDEDWTRNYAC